jgi:hypothetical protein
MAAKRTISVNILYFLIVILVFLLLIVSTLLYYKIVEKNVKVVDRCPPCPSCPSCVSCPKAESTIPVYPKELPTYDGNRENPVAPAANAAYQQVGILTSNDETEPTILPLFSKRANNHRDRWNYYTTTDKNTMLRLPIRHDNMNCDDDIGCNEIYDGNTLYIEMYKGKTFKATIYKKQTLSYFADKY